MQNTSNVSITAPANCYIPYVPYQWNYCPCCGRPMGNFTPMWLWDPNIAPTYNTSAEKPKSEGLGEQLTFKFTDSEEDEQRCCP